MSYNIHFLSPASFELNEAFEYYEMTQLGLGIRFVEEIDNYLNQIKENPLLFSKHTQTEELRSDPLKIFPFIIAYWVVEEKKIIYIDSIFHTKRKPKSYKSL